jgi:hypothetical protein
VDGAVRLPDAAQDRETGGLCRRYIASRGRNLVNATTFRFDGSDLMPGKIGAGAFWTGMIDLVGGKPAPDAVAATSRKPGTA